MSKLANAAAPGEINLIGQGAVFEGTLRVEGDVRVNGRVAGQLHVNGRAIVAQEGVVEGDIKATEAEIAGKVQGELHIEKRLTLRGSANVEGNIETGRLVLEEGAIFDGECRMGVVSKQSLKKAELPTKLPKETQPVEPNGASPARTSTFGGTS